ncbi:hypothetical protein LTR85_009501 [Meristemomyces frigidus]|nr:hypothetical protein LTR85_009501 [Meristemomyces frigidus]
MCSLYMDLEQESSATLRVLALPELFEPIILELPVLTIISTATRISRRLGDVVDTSTKIQQKLFLKPDKSITKPPKYSPRSCYGPFYHHQLTLNPVLKSDILSWSNAGEARMRLVGQHQVIVVTGWRGERAVSGLPDAVYRPEVSWRQMFVTSPPCTELEVELQQVSNDGADSDETTRWITVRDEKGVKLGMLEDAAIDMNAEWRRTAFNADAEVSNYFKFYIVRGSTQEVTMGGPMKQSEAKKGAK